MPTPPRPRPTRRPKIDGKKIAALGVVIAASAVLVGYFVWMVKPAAAREAIAACNGMKGNPQNPALGTIPRPAPDFTVQTIDGKPVKLSDFRGKVVLLHYWASWCGACEQEKPSLAKMAEDLVGRDFEVVTVASDIGWDPVKKSLPPGGVPFRVYLDRPEEEGTIGPISTSWGTKAVPESFLIDRKGRIRYYFDNRRDWDSPVTETCIQSLIDE
jgi:peroxiredoxin